MIGIILVLIAIVVVGLRHVNNTAARQETVAEMKICTDALKEYQAISGLKGIESDTLTAPPQTIQLPTPWGSTSATGQYASGSYTLPLFLDPPAGSNNEIKSAQPSSALQTTDTTISTFGDMGDKAGVANPRWSSNAVRWTQAVMYLLLKDPKNRALVANLPPKRILEAPPALTAGAQVPPFTIDAAVPLDGWGNPIIFVPRGGLHVFINPTGAAAPAEYVIRSSGVFPVGSLPPLSANDHPFFASAGQDGFFTDPANSVDLAVDNLYSFQDQ